MVISTGKPIAMVAWDLGIHDGTLANWVNAWRWEHPEPDQPLSPVERARVEATPAGAPTRSAFGETTRANAPAPKSGLVLRHPAATTSVGQPAEPGAN
jgi:transposase-like protein